MERETEDGLPRTNITFGITRSHFVPSTFREKVTVMLKVVTYQMNLNE